MQVPSEGNFYIFLSVRVQCSSEIPTVHQPASISKSECDQKLRYDLVWPDNYNILLTPNHFLYGQMGEHLAPEVKMKSIVIQEMIAVSERIGTTLLAKMMAPMLIVK